MKKAQRTLAYFIGGGLRLRSSRSEYLETSPSTNVNKQDRHLYTFSFMLHAVNREQVIFYNYGQDGGWDQGLILYVTADNKLKVRAKSVYIGAQDMDREDVYTLQAPYKGFAYSEKLLQGGTMFIGIDTLVVNKVYTVVLWGEGRPRVGDPQYYKGVGFDPQLNNFAEYPSNGHEVWLNGRYQGFCGPTPVTLGGQQSLGFGHHPKPGFNLYADMTLFHFDAFTTNNLTGRALAGLNQFFTGVNVSNDGRGADMNRIHNFNGITRSMSFNFRKSNTNPLVSTVGNYRFEFHPRYSIQAKNDALKQHTDLRFNSGVIQTSTATPNTDSNFLRDHIFENGNQTIVNLGLTGDIDSFDNSNTFPVDYNTGLNIRSNQLSGTSVITYSNISTFDMSNQTGPGTNDITWGGQTKPLLTFSANGSKVSRLQFAAGTSVGNLYMDSNPLPSFDFEPLRTGIPGDARFDNCTSLTTFTPPTTLAPAGTGFILSAKNTALNGINLTNFNTGWRIYDFTSSSNFFNDVIFPTSHQRILSFTLTDFPRAGTLDFRNLPGLAAVTLVNGINVTNVLFTNEGVDANNYQINNLGVSSLNLTPVSAMTGQLVIANNTKLSGITYPSSINTMNGIGIVGNPILAGIQDLRWATKGTNELFIHNNPEVANWIFPDTINVANAAILGNSIGAMVTKTPQVADFTRTKIQGQFLWDGSNITEFRFSAASFGNGGWTMGRFELGSCNNLTRFDLVNYPSSTWNTLKLQYCASLSVLTFPTQNITFHTFNIRGCVLNQHIPFDKVLIEGGVTIDGNPMSGPNMNSSIQALYASRALHGVASQQKDFYMDNIQQGLLTGNEVPPSGYSEGVSDGTPTTTNEMIWVLENQRIGLGGALKYNWVFFPNPTVTPA